MVTNGLCDLTAAGAQCRQKITLSLVDHPSTRAMQKLSRATGKVEEIELPIVSTRRQLELEIDGGTCELLKFKTGAPFVGTK